MRNQDLGFSKDQMIVMDTYGDPAKDAFKQSLAGIPDVKSISYIIKCSRWWNPGAYSEIENTKGDLQIANLDLYFVDFDYINQYKIKMVAGRGFSKICDGYNSGNGVERSCRKNVWI